jgi:hypothetical protein
MVFVPEAKTDEDKKKEEEQQGSSGAVPLTATPAAPAGQGQAPIATPEAKGSGQFADLSKFLGANKAKNEEYAKAITGGLKTGIETEAAGLGDIASKAAKTLESQKSDFGGLATTGFSKGSGTYNKWAEIIGGGQKLAAIPDAEIAAGKEKLAGLVGQAEKTKDYAGQQVLVEERAAKQGGSATSGENKLNTYLLNRDLEAQKALGDLRQTAGQTQAEALKKVTDLGATASDVAAWNKAQAEKAKQVLSGSESTMRGEIQKIQDTQAGKVKTQNEALDRAIAGEAQELENVKGRYIADSIQNLSKKYGPDQTRWPFEAKKELAVAKAIAADMQLPSRARYRNAGVDPNFATALYDYTQGGGPYDKLATLEALAELSGSGNVYAGAQKLGDVWDIGGWQNAMNQEAARRAANEAAIREKVLAGFTPAATANIDRPSVAAGQVLDKGIQTVGQSPLNELGKVTTPTITSQPTGAGYQDLQNFINRAGDTSKIGKTAREVVSRTIKPF